MKNYVILLATEDSAVEAVVRAMGSSVDCELHCVRSGRDGVSMVMDGSSNRDLAVVDLDMNEGGRTLLTTAGGALPVIAIAAKPKPWLAAMVRRRRIGAALTKPVSPERLRAAWGQMQMGSESEAQRGN